MVLLMLGSWGHNDPAVVNSIEVVGFGSLEVEVSANTADASSSVVGTRLARARKIRISHQTDRISLRLGTSYGVAFVVQGTAPDRMVEIQAVLRSSSPCVLKETGESVYQNDTIPHVKLGEARYVGATIAAPQDRHCKNVPGPGMEKFELRYRGLFAEKTFEIVRSGDG